jgi:arylsulfatase A-like enzyme
MKNSSNIPITEEISERFSQYQTIADREFEHLSRKDFLNLVLTGLLAIPLASCANFGLSSKPNIVVIMADDIGLGDIGFYHAQRTGKPSVIPTTNIDRMISDGIRFNDAHAPNSLCAPSRFSMLTGNYSIRNEKPFGAWRPWANPGIEPKYTTIARIAKRAGYATSFLGKWGCGGQLKEKDTGVSISNQNNENADYTQIYKSANYFGFDYALELPVGIQNYPYIFYEDSKWMPLAKNSKLEQIGPVQHKLPDSKSGIGDSNWDPSQVGEILASKAVRYIEKQTVDNPNQPFFMYYCSQAVHVPHTPPDELGGTLIAGSTPSAHGDMVHELDVQVGKIIKCLKERGVIENTLLIFTSDNGGLPPEITTMSEFEHDASNGLRGSKGSIYEGGDRVPFIAVWPNKIKPGIESNEPIVGHDIVATIAAITKQRVSTDVVKDSFDLLPLFYGDTNTRGHEIILQQSPNGNMPNSVFYAIRRREWKLVLLSPNKKNMIGLKPIALFNLSKNPFEDEEYNLINREQYKDLVNELLSEYLQIRATDMATVNNNKPNLFS